MSLLQYVSSVWDDLRFMLFNIIISLQILET